ncbi:NAD-dependent epimerase/dehydratase family protein [Nitrosomonas sp.]|uniref:NAD-dependent epimerase/dehydratase family protein n=1 Tax=Nitrosomonas sp. TaxID=42353 RepID=UPI0025DC9A2C|nr:NAD-dependent epimerase/dehydratase family protein [Nitrosomonas sp.]MBV6448250.1 UDP-glucose 4-epimerase [Nitrosomonas sp.]
MAILVTGAAGFIGCNMVQRLLASNHRIFGIDNLSNGSRKNIAHSLQDARFVFVEADLSDLSAFMPVAQQFHSTDPITEVWHLAANSDIPAGIDDAGVDLRDTFMTTFNTLEVMKRLKIKQLAFASTSAVYGDHENVRLHEDIGPLLPISNYGAMKLASEALISAAAEAWLERAWIFRFPNVIGVPATHGALLDFIRKLRQTPDNLNVLGNGTQQKGYLHVSELIDAMLYIREFAEERLAYYNIGSDDEGVTVRFMAEQVVAAAAPAAKISFGEGNKGWVGDVPRFVYSIEKLRALGWQPKIGSADAIKLAIHEIIDQEMHQ